jgi:uncharacterized protein (DUF433 family)
VAYPVSPYIEARYGGLYVAGTRVSLDSVVIRFQQGASPEKIVRSNLISRCRALGKAARRD